MALKKPRSEKPFPQSEPLTYRTGSLAAETQERSVVCDGAVCLPADQDSTRLRLSTTDALSCSAFYKMEGAPCVTSWAAHGPSPLDPRTEVSEGLKGPVTGTGERPRPRWAGPMEWEWAGPRGGAGRGRQVLGAGRAPVEDV